MGFWNRAIKLMLVVWMMGNGVGMLTPSTLYPQPLSQHTPQEHHQKSLGGLKLKLPSEPTPHPAPLLHTTVKTTISGLIARTTISQRFYNPSSDWAEGIYVFPLPELAAVDHMWMRIGERTIEGIIKERVKAKNIYAKAKAKGKQASLLEQERPNIFTASVANIAPGQPIIVEIEYQELVRYDQNRFSIRVPLVVGPRYIPGTGLEGEKARSGKGWGENTDQVPDASRMTPPVQHPSQGPLNSLTLLIDLAPGFQFNRLESPTHPIRVEDQSTGNSHITLRENSSYADRDFVLVWTPHPSQEPQTTLYLEEQEKETFGMLFILPPQSLEAERENIAREVIFVIDTSGSMAGTSIFQAKAALQLAVSRLAPNDRFNIIQFNSSTNRVFAQAQPAQPHTKHRALSYVAGLQANGGTEMLPALIQALSNPEEHTHLRQVIFMTDGLIGNEEELFSTIHRLLGSTRLFTIGIGSAPNSHFMRKAAQHGRGTFTYIPTAQAVQETMDRLFMKLDHPGLIDITLESSTPGPWDWLPHPVPDIYAGEPLMIAFQATTPPASFKLSGRQGSMPWSRELFLKSGITRPGISTHWARQKIAQLMDQQTQGQDKTQARKQILDIALKHHLVSRYTSLVAVETTPVRPANRPVHSHSMKTNLPQGMHYEAVFGWPQTATPASLFLLLGTMILWMTGKWIRHHTPRR